MFRKFVHRISALGVALLLVLGISIPAFASYSGECYDYAGLLSDSQVASIRETISQITEYGGITVYTNPADNAYSGSANLFAKEICRDLYSGSSGTVLLIDMYNRRIEFFSTGKMYKLINKSRANAISDNIYSYATNGDYYGCIQEGLNQILIIMEGGKLAEPMRYVSNVLIAVSIGLMICFGLATMDRKKHNLGKRVLLAERPQYTDGVDIISKVMTRQRKVSNSSSSGSGGGGFSGGGGGFSGGGGGHSF